MHIPALILFDVYDDRGVTTTNCRHVRSVLRVSWGSEDATKVGVWTTVYLHMATSDIQFYTSVPLHRTWPPRRKRRVDIVTSRGLLYTNRPSGCPALCTGADSSSFLPRCRMRSNHTPNPFTGHCSEAVRLA